MNELMERISSLRAEEIDDMLYAVIRRKRELYPDWDILYYACPKGEVNIPEKICMLLQNKDKQ